MSAESTSSSTIHQCRVADTDAGERLDKWLSGVVDTLSRARLRQLIEQGHVRVDGVTILDPARRVKQGQSAEVEEPPPVDATPLPQAMDLVVVYEDDDLIVIDKPPGLVVHPAPGNPDRTLVNALLAHCGDSLSGIGGERRPGIVHRLDKDTSGLMIAAKTDLAHRGLAEQFAVHSLERAYIALVWGTPVPPAGTVDAPIGRHQTQRKRMAVVRGPNGKRAVTDYKTLRSLEGVASVVECRLHTGRTHQVRVHMAHLGHPLLGDSTYGRRNAPKHASTRLLTALSRLDRQALHSYRIGFLHPRTNAALHFETELPNDIKSIIDVSA